MELWNIPFLKPHACASFSRKPRVQRRATTRIPQPSVRNWCPPPKFPGAVRSVGDVAAAAVLPPLYKPTPTEQLTAQAEAGGGRRGVYLMTQHAFVRAWNAPRIRGKYAENLVLWKVNDLAMCLSFTGNLFLKRERGKAAWISSCCDCRMKKNVNLLRKGK